MSGGTRTKRSTYPATCDRCGEDLDEEGTCELCGWNAFDPPDDDEGYFEPDDDEIAMMGKDRQE